MTALVAPALYTPTLDQALEIKDLNESRNLYNRLPDDSAQPAVADQHVANLAALFVRHNAQDVLGIHLIHGHFQIPENTVMLGTNFEGPALRWTQTTGIDTIDSLSVHGHIYAITEHGFCPYELQDGPLPDFSKVGHGFLPEFVDYVVKNELQNIIGLQVLGGESPAMSELILDRGTVMLETSIIKNATPYRITGWRFESRNGEPRVCAANETHSGMTSGNHKVFNAGKPIPKLENVDDLRIALVQAGLL